MYPNKVVAKTNGVPKKATRKASGGRPTRAAAEQLADKIIDVATQLMLENGYSHTSIEAVANAAGVAKRTLYSRFPDKSDLFAAVIQRRREAFLGPVQKISAAGGSIDEQLLQIGNHMLSWGLQNDTIAIKRLITAEVERFPELSALVHNTSRTRTIDTLAAIFDREIKSGALTIADSRFAAMQFLEMIMAPADLQAHYGFGGVTGKKRRDYIISVVNLFLNGCRVRGKQKKYA
ncbi:MAG TPA: TetR/AcrR family transcriptional regulator [Spongiibacteraceae bacterium]